MEYLVCFSLDDNLDPHDVDVPVDKELKDLERAQLLLFLGWKSPKLTLGSKIPKR